MSKRPLYVITAVLISIMLTAGGLGHVPTYAQEGTPTTEAEKACTDNTNHPVAKKLAENFGVSYTEVMDLHCNQNRGFGELARAYALVKKTAGTENPATLAAIFAMRDEGKGWGEILKAYSVKNKDLIDKGGKGNGKDNKGNGKGNKGNGKGNNGKGKGNKGNLNE